MDYLLPVGVLFLLSYHLSEAAPPITALNVTNSHLPDMVVAAENVPVTQLYNIGHANCTLTMADIRELQILRRNLTLITDQIVGSGPTPNAVIADQIKELRSKKVPGRKVVAFFEQICVKYLDEHKNLTIGHLFRDFVLTFKKTVSVMSRGVDASTRLMYTEFVDSIQDDFPHDIEKIVKLLHEKHDAFAVLERKAPRILYDIGLVLARLPDDTPTSTPGNLD